MAQTEEEYQTNLETRSNDDELQKAWNDYKAKFNKTYTSAEQHDCRFKIFIENKKLIDEHNAKYEKGETTYKMGLNGYTDCPKEEYQNRFGSRSHPKN